MYNCTVERPHLYTALPPVSPLPVILQHFRQPVFVLTAGPFPSGLFCLSCRRKWLAAMLFILRPSGPQLLSGARYREKQRSGRPLNAVPNGGLYTSAVVLFSSLPVIGNTPDCVRPALFCIQRGRHPLWKPPSVLFMYC